MLTVEKQNRTSFQASITIHYSCWITSQPASSIWGLCVMISCHHFVYSWLLRARRCWWWCWWSTSLTHPKTTTSHVLTRTYTDCMRTESKHQIKNSDSRRGNSRKNNSLFLPSQLFLGTNRLNLHRASVRHNGVMIRAARCFCGTSCVFAIGWQWYYDWGVHTDR